MALCATPPSRSVGQFPEVLLDLLGRKGGCGSSIALADAAQQFPGGGRRGAWRPRCSPRTTKTAPLEGGFAPSAAIHIGAAEATGAPRPFVRLWGTDA